MTFRVAFLVVLVALVQVSVTPALAQEPVAAPDITILEQGSKPRIEIRVQPEKGGTEKVEMSLFMEMSMSVGGMPMPQQALPGQIFTIGAEVLDVAGNGDIDYTFEYLDAEVAPGEAMPQVVEFMKQQQEAFIGLKGTGVVTDQNFIKSFTMDALEDADPSVVQNLESMQRSMREFSTPFPDEAVGVGGKWQVVNEVDNMGMQIQQTTTYTVTAIDKKSVSLDVTVTQSAEPQDLVMQGMNFHLDSFQSSGSGTASFDRNRILPKHSSVSIDMTMKLSTDVQGQPQQMDMEMGMKMAMSEAEEE